MTKPIYTLPVVSNTVDVDAFEASVQEVIDDIYTANISRMPDTVNVQEYLPADTQSGDTLNADHIKAALEAFFADRIANIYFPAGRFYIPDLVLADFPLTGSNLPQHLVTINGAGTIFEIPDTNEDGFLHIRTYNNSQMIDVDGLCIQSDAAFAGSTTNGTALYLEHMLEQGDAGWGSPYNKQASVRNCRVVQTDPNTTGRWDNGIVIKGFSFATANHNFVQTRKPSSEGDPLNPPTFESGDGIRFSDCYAPEAIGNKINGGWSSNLHLTEVGGARWEDMDVRGNILANGNFGLRVEMTSADRLAATDKEPGGRIEGNHANGFAAAIRIADRREVTVSNNHLYINLGDGKAHPVGGEAFIEVEDCREINIHNNHVPAGGYYTSDSDTAAGVRILGDSRFIRISGNTLGNEGVGIDHQGTSDEIWVDGNSWITDAQTAHSGIEKPYIITGSGTLRGSDIVQTATPTVIFGAGANDDVVLEGTSVTEFVETDGWVDAFVRVKFTSKGTDTGSITIDPNLPLPVLQSNSRLQFFNVVQTALWSTAPQAGFMNDSGLIKLYHFNANNNTNQDVDDTDLTGSNTLIEMNVRYRGKATI